MSILINGMEMPTGNNAVSIIIFPNGKVSLAHDHRFAEYAEAVPIPPHGRLIDADALEASCFMGSSSFYTQSDIDYAPTIIQKEKGE